MTRARRALAILSIALACGGATLFAEAIDPTLAAAEFIRAVQRGDKAYLRRYVDLAGISGEQGGGCTYKDLRKLFAKVDVKRLEWSARTFDEKTKVITIRTTRPASLRFEFQHANDFYRDRMKSVGPCWPGEKNLPGCVPLADDFYLIIGVHPL